MSDDRDNYPVQKVKTQRLNENNACSKYKIGSKFLITTDKRHNLEGIPAPLWSCPNGPIFRPQRITSRRSKIYQTLKRNTTNTKEVRVKQACIKLGLYTGSPEGQHVKLSILANQSPEFHGESLNLKPWPTIFFMKIVFGYTCWSACHLGPMPGARFLAWPARLDSKTAAGTIKTAWHMSQPGAGWGWGMAYRLFRHGEE